MSDQSDHDAILRAIIEEPDDKAHRLVYADWLEEFGTSEAERARAGFIRIQCAKEWDPRPDTEEARELYRRARKLRDKHEAEWIRPLGLPRGWHVSFNAGWVGGFVESARLTALQFLQQAPKLTRLTPLR